MKNDNWLYKLKYVHCWNLKLNRDNGQFLQKEINFPQQLPNGEEMHVVSSDFSLISEDPTGLFCHKNKTVTYMGFDYIMDIIEVSPKSLVIIGSIESQSKLCAKLVEKNSLIILADCTTGDVFAEVGLFVTSVSEDRIVLCSYDGEIEVFSFQEDPPYIGHDFCQLLSLPIEGIVHTEFSGHYCVLIDSFKLDLFKADFTNVAQEKKLYQKIWSLDISNQTSLPKLKFSSAMVDFPFIYVCKSNGMLLEDGS